MHPYHIHFMCKNTKDVQCKKQPHVDGNLLFSHPCGLSGPAALLPDCTDRKERPLDPSAECDRGQQVKRVTHPLCKHFLEISHNCKAAVDGRKSLKLKPHMVTFVHISLLVFFLLFVFAVYD